MVDRYEALAEVPMFAFLPKRHLRRIARQMLDYEFEAGRTIVRQGENGETLFVLLEGRARVVRGGRAVARLRPGDFFGELAVLDDRPRTASVVADSPVRCVVLHRDELRKILAEEPRAAWALLRAMAGRLRGD
jgi:CRP-like cAMP-binding protein